MINPISSSKAAVKIALLFLLLFSPIQYFSQSGSATLSGYVKDAGGAAVVGATVRAINTATNRPFNTTTRQDGLYTFVELQPGNYRIEVEQTGFQRSVKETLTLNIASRVAQDFTLTVGEVSATVTVSDSSATIERDSAVVSTVVNREFVENIPLNGRTFQSLLELTPGVVLAAPDATNPGQFSVNGQRTNSNYFIVDGIGANSGTTPIATSSQQAAGTLPSTTVIGGFNNLLSVDELEEFRVMTSTFSPEYGRSPGAQVIMRSRAGTNRYNGTVSHYLRNEKFDANNFFNNRSNIPRGKLRQNHFGFTFGGPVIIPGFGSGTPFLHTLRDKTFFFVSYENLRVRQPVFRSANTPTAFARSEAVRLGLTDIATFLNGYPLPTGPGIVAGAQAYIGRYEQGISNPIEMDSIGVRIDHHFNSRFSIFGRYKHTPSENDSAIASFPNQTNYYNVTTSLFTFGSTFMAADNLTFDMRANYTKDDGDYLWNPQNVNGAVVPDLELLMPEYTSSQNASASVFFGNSMNQTRGRTWGNGQRQLNVVGTGTWLTGDHQIKFGIDYRRLKPKIEARSYGFTYNFGTLQNLLNPAHASFGKASIQIQALSPAGQFEFLNYSAFAQDTWKVNQALTLSYGLRWDVNLPPTSSGELPFAINGLNDPMTATLAPRGTKAFEPDYKGIAPRFGVAYSMNNEGTLVLRGGVGLFYDSGTGQATRGYSSFPYNALKTTNNVPFILGSAALNAALVPPSFNLDPPYSSQFYVYNRDEDFTSPRTIQYNLSVQKGLGSKQSVTASFVGSHGRKLLFTETLSNAPGIPELGVPVKNWINPIFGSASNSSQIYMTDNRGRSDYTALQLQYDRRLTKGLQVLASYSYAVAKDNASSEIAGGSGAIRVDPDNEYGHSNYDIRHNFSAALTYRIPSLIKSGFGKKVFNGFAVDLLTRARSAAPYDLLVSYYDAATFTSYTTRPNLKAGEPLYIYDDNLPGGRRANTNAFEMPGPTSVGNFKRNTLRGFPLFQTDLSLRREFKFHERLRVQLRAEAFNVFNHANFATSASAATAIRRQWSNNAPLDTYYTTVGLSTSTLSNQLGGTGGLNSLYTVGGPRSMQFAAKIIF